MAIDVTRPGHHRGRIPANKGATYPAEVLTPGEVLRLLAVCSPRSATGTRHRALIVMMYRAGLRSSEALALRPKDVDLHAGSVAVLHGKGDRRRTHAFELMMEGIPMPVIQSQLGHASLATTDTYLSHIAPKEVIETIRKRRWSCDAG